MFMAAQNGHDEVVRALIAANGDPNLATVSERTRGTMVEMREAMRRTADQSLALASPLDESCTC